jgi:hypothetical protein
MEKHSKIKYKCLTNVSELAMAIYREQGKDISITEIYDYIGKYFVLGYEVWKDDKLKGWSYSLKINGIYTLDGHNEGVSVFSASTAGKLVVRDIFKDYADIIITVHDTGDKALDALVKRIGFRKWFEYEDTTQFFMVKEWER